ncbi:aldo-keto reductase family 1 member B1-like isoform X2 [Venturia canescens]|uniref:aldo-keto reductase family 1 member B1-like isoform X2 n=1 Tax=Venturia canescens TaxID=32260 RepID=UPI001C9C2F8C|nr:aldo-keto reductase family 1 member B1-like isoform X2 [Venturia canescens]
MAFVQFYNGNKTPSLGLGTWKSKSGEVEQAVKEAIDIGYRHIDCAPVYGNEKEIGAALSAKIKAGAIKRSDIFITSKLWNTKHRPEVVEPALKNTLKDLCLEYLDLYLIHWPFAFKGWLLEAPELQELPKGEELFPATESGEIETSDIDYVDTWKAMESLVDKGLVKNIGISNFNSKQIDRLLANCRIKPVTNQVECHPYLAQVKLSEFCASREIKITAYSPLGSPDRPWAKPEDALLLEDRKIKSIASKYKKTPAQVILRYQLERGHIVIPKSVSKNRIQENFDILDFKLSPEDVQQIHTFDCRGRICSMSSCVKHKYYPFGEDFEF